MPYWDGCENGSHWSGEDIDLWASVEPSGGQIAGTMSDDIWEDVEKEIDRSWGMKLANQKKDLILSILTGHFLFNGELTKQKIKI